MAALRSAQSGGDKSACEIGRERYIQLCIAIYRHLVPGRVTSNAYQLEARASAERDFARDSRGRPHLERTAFMDAMFELADHYVPSLEAADYIAFLLGLLESLSIAAAAEPALLWRERPVSQLKRPPAPDLIRPPTATSPKRSPGKSKGTLHGSTARLERIAGFQPSPGASPTSKNVLPGLGTELWVLPPRW